MKVFARVALGAIAMASASAAIAANYNWTQSLLGPNVYGANSEDSNFFTTPTAVPATGAKITTITWSYGRYQNGSTGQLVKICYADRYGSNYYKCLDVSNAASGSSSFFSGIDAKGKFKMTFTLTGGGTYPATSGFRNSLLVNYTAP